MSSDHRKQRAASLALELLTAPSAPDQQQPEPELKTMITRSNPQQQASTESRDMKFRKKQANSIDYKRKKRKERSFSAIMMHEMGQTTAATTATSWRVNKTTTRTIIDMLLCMILMKLLCDNMKSAIVNAEQQDAPNRTRFVEEPQDTYALLGQTADLACSLENYNGGTLLWHRKTTALTNGGDPMFDRYSLPNYHPRAGGGPPPSADDLSSPTVTNYSLHIDPVTLNDDGSFHCRLFDKGGSAKLTVLHPPDHLNIKALPVEEGDEQEESEFYDRSSSDIVGGPLEADSRTVKRIDSQQLNVAAAAAELQFERNFPNQLHETISMQRVTDGPDSASANGGSNWTKLTLSPSQMDQNDATLQRDNPTEIIDRVIVKQNARLRLECSTGPTKPHTELVWLDHLNQPVPKRHENDNASSYSYVDEEIRVDPKEDRMAASSLVWSFKVQRHHQDQVFTCLAKHPAFELPQHLPRLYGRAPRVRIRLEVHYKPDILGLLKEPSQAYENQSIAFQCQAQGKPNDLTYRWFIDRQLVANATKPELRIERLTRQMHLREIKCQVRNSAGVSSIGHRLHVRYAPAFITHLLPESLQPAQDHHELQMLTMAASRQLPAAKQHHQPANWLLDPAELTIGGQLTRGYLLGQEVQLRCDFDANPRIQQVQWFKVMNEKYSIMGNVTPAEADELIALGEARAHFIKRKEAPTDLGEEEEEQQRRSMEAEQRKRRHNLTPRHLEGVSMEPQAEQNPLQLDYELMSENLLDELASYEDQLAGGQSNDSFVSQNFEKIPSQPPTQTTVPIQEPLRWLVRAAGQQAPPTSVNHATKPRIGATHNEPPMMSGQPDSLIILPANEPLAPSSGSSGSLPVLAIQKREAQVTSSWIRLNKTNYESAGKYICRARSADGSTSVARSIYLVLKGQPRIISNPNQWAPFGASKLQVECLAQTRGVVDNMTSFTWYKEGKPVTLRKESGGGSNGERSYSMELKRSPDLLYVRSILHVDGAEFHDFGRYSCLVINSFGNDSMPINLQPSAPTGFVFAVMASMAIGSVLLLVCVLGLLMICAPQQRKHQEAKGSLANNQPHGDMVGKSFSSSSHSIDSHEDRKTLSCNAAGHTAISRKEQELCCDNESVINSSTKQQQQQFVSNQAAINSMMILGGNQLSSQQRQQDQTDQTSDISSQGSNGHKLQSSDRSSLRQPIVANNNNNHHHQQRSTKFAAIHESLEHKLHLGQPGLFGQHHHHRQVSIDSTNGHQTAEKSQPTEQQATDATKTEAVSELEEEGSILNRLWARLLMRPEKLGAGGSRRVKSRPIISTPISVGPTKSNIRRSSLSTSLSVLGTDLSDTASADNAKNNLKRANNNGVNLVSSSANLIQDSTTASDGSGSSGRSSSNSSGGQVTNNELNHQASGQQQINNGMIHVAYATTTGAAGDAYMSQRAINNDAIQWPSNGGIPMTDCSMYVNETFTANNPHHLTSYHRPLENNNIYSNGHLAYKNQDPSYPMTNIGYTSQALGWSDHSQSAPIGHYQQPLPTSESYFSPGCPQSQQQSFYATICNNNNKPAPHYGVVSSNNNIATTTNNNSNTNTNYITLPHRPASTQCHTQGIITTDAGDAFFDQNYGTMLSRSKAYTKLGYATSSALTATHYITAHSVSSSSSPSSSSHTNTVPPNLNLDTITQQLQAVKSTAGCELSPISSNYNEMHTTMVQSDGSTTTKATVDDNGLATHV